MVADRPKVFLSYSHDSPDHMAAVLKLARRLRDDGCTVIIDQEHLWVSEGLTLWMKNQIEQANFVLMICTESYKRRAEGKEEAPTGAGVSWEGAIIRRDLYEANGRNDKFIPVLMRHEDKVHLPFFLRDYPYFVATELDGYRNLCEVLKPTGSKLVVGPGIWKIPAPNPYFSGREEYLKKLRDILTTSSQPAALTQAIKGLGGMGKTQTALKYADLHRAEYSAGFWAVADSRENLLSGFARFAELLDLPEKDDKEIANAAAAAKRWFESNGNWLLILDSVEDWAVVQEWLPSSKRGHILITTRLQSTGTLARAIELPKMSPDEGAKFLLERSKIELPSDADVLAAKTIAQEFGGLPLGLEQAGAYIEDAKLSPGEYFELYQREGKKLRDRGSASADHATVTVTFTLAFEKLGEFARQIVRMAAFLAPDAIPEEVLTGGKDPDLDFRDAVADGARFSLIQRTPATKTIDIHRLVQDVVKDTMSPEVQRDFVERSADAIGKRFPEEVDFANWSTCERLLPHARVVAAQILACCTESASAAYLLHQTAWYLKARRQDKDAGAFNRRALEIREIVLGSDHPDTAKSLNNLAGLYQSQEQYKEAEPLYRRALEINERVLGEDHPDTATSLDNLATLYDSQGEYKEAEPLHRRALEIREKALGPDHPDTATSLNNLAGLYGGQGKYKEAEPLHRRALEIREKALGPDHPATASSLNNLAEVYKSQGKYKESEHLHRRALEIREKALGPDHPDSATSLNNLAGLSSSQGRYKEAEPRYRRALEIREKALGPDHPDTATSLHNLGMLYANRGRFLQAESLLRRALAIAENALGIQHPRTTRLFQSYLHVLQKLGHRHAAHKLQERFQKKD